MQYIGLTLNVDKSKYVVFRRQQSGGYGKTRYVYIEGSDIGRTNTVNFLRLQWFEVEGSC